MRKDSGLRRALLLTAAAAALILLIFAACRDEPENVLPPVASGTVVVTPGASIPTNVDPSIRGYITRITNTAEYTEILVEYFPGEDEISPYQNDKVLVKLDDKSAVAYGRANEAYSRTMLGVGSQVEVWFTDPAAESFPVIAYGQAVRVTAKPSSMTSIRTLPHLSVSGGSTCITVVRKATWYSHELNDGSVTEVLKNVSGAHMSAEPGDLIALKFSSAPSSFTAHWTTAPYSSGLPLEVTDGKITVPATASGMIYIKVDAEWGVNTVQYVFSITVPENQDNA